ncbi:uncharacterized protein FA14DRAFT_184956 [Meira miltonrushii]|uniref:Uncharacterized protein n=1 Tax=Meira miltonrushii TaxID=1280837 RepID=A0A316V3T2_9BASI|nr:uncharacterized protein FA14DRAFT_184956 [Meira miltonrushii]PWN31191.1 hypothetical protein FA14DRAFT_184956 [Meira miltonrushii]
MSVRWTSNGGRYDVAVAFYERRRRLVEVRTIYQERWITRILSKETYKFTESIHICRSVPISLPTQELDQLNEEEQSVWNMAEEQTKRNNESHAKGSHENSRHMHRVKMVSSSHRSAPSRGYGIDSLGYWASSRPSSYTFRPAVKCQEGQKAVTHNAADSKTDSSPSMVHSNRDAGT